MSKSLSISFGLNYHNIDSISSLGACIKDANDFRNLLSDNGYQATLQVDLHKGIDVDNFKDKILELIKENPKNATITFAGHGTSVRDYSGDEDDGLDEALIFYDRHFVDDDFREFLYNSLAESEIENLFFIFDCCRSGSICDLKYKNIDSEETGKEDANCLSNLKTKILCVSACTDYQNAQETSEGGFLTQSIINNYQDISMLELFDSVNMKLSSVQSISVSSNKKLDYSQCKLFKEIVEDTRTIGEGKTKAMCGKDCSIM